MSDYGREELDPMEQLQAILWKQAMRVGLGEQDDSSGEIVVVFDDEEYER